MRLLLIRHGDPDYSTDSLTPRGRKEAKALAEFLKEQPISRIYTSPLGRARETAQITADALGLPVMVEEWTRELSELHIHSRGMVAWDLDGFDLHQALKHPEPGGWHQWGDFATLPLRQCLERIETASDAFLARHGYEREGDAYVVRERNEETIALFCHGGFGLTWLAHLLRIAPPLAWTGFFLHTSSITTILLDERQNERATPRCLWIGALPHLWRAGLEPSQAGIKANYI